MAANVIMPQMGESIFEGTITKWLRKVGDSVKRDEPLFEISTDKVDSEIPAPASGILSEIRVKEGETVQINTVVAVISEDDVAQATARQTAAPQPDAVSPESQNSSRLAAKPSVGQVERLEGSQTVRSSPLVRRIAKVENVDLSDLEGTGLGGRITKKDILNY